MKLTRRQLRKIIKEEAVTVKSGDTMYDIAKANNVGIDALLAANPQFDASQLGNWKRGDTPGDADVVGGSNRNPNWIYPGDKLNIPGDSGGGGGGGPAKPKGAPGAGVELDSSAAKKGEVVVQALGKDLVDGCMQEKLQMLQKIEDYVKKLKEEMGAKTGEGGVQ